MWTAEAWSDVALCAEGVRFRYVSEGGEEGYAGTVAAEAMYGLTTDNRLVMRFRCHNTGDTATPVNMCNHTYWNLSGDLKEPIYNHVRRLRPDDAPRRCG